MNIHEYYQKAGRNQPIKDLNQAHDKILNDIRQDRVKGGNVLLKQRAKQLEEFLYHFDKANKKGKKFVEQQLESIQRLVNIGIDEGIDRATKEHVIEGFNIFNDATYQQSNPEQLIARALSSEELGYKSKGLSGQHIGGNENKREYAMQVKTFQRYVDACEKAIQKIAQNPEDYVINDKQYEELKNLLKKIQTDGTNTISTLYGSKKNTSTKILFYSPKSEIQEQVCSCVGMLKALIKQLTQTDPVDKNQIGDVFESFMTVFYSWVLMGKDIAISDIADDVMKSMAKNIMTGSKGKTTTDSTLQVTLKVDDADLRRTKEHDINLNRANNLLKQTQLYQKMLKSKNKPSMKFNTDLIVQKSGLKVKADLIIEQTNEKISLKNWEDIEMKNFKGKTVSHSLGSTSLFKAILRSNNESIYEKYIYAARDYGPERDGSSGIKARLAAHRLAKISLIADVVAGYFQKQQNTNANVLIINDRKNKQILIFDIAEIINACDKVAETESPLFLDGYKEFSIGLDLLALFKGAHRQRQTDHTRSSFYKGLASNYLDSLTPKVMIHEAQLKALAKK